MAPQVPGVRRLPLRSSNRFIDPTTPLYFAILAGVQGGRKSPAQRENFSWPRRGVGAKPSSARRGATGLFVHANFFKWYYELAKGNWVVVFWLIDVSGDDPHGPGSERSY